MTASHFNRRLFLQGLAATGCVAALGLPAARAADGAALRTQKLSERISVITGAGGNVVFFKGDQGITLIDCGLQEQAAGLLALVDELSGKAPVHTLFNTHWHEDHTGGNEAVHARGAQIIAHENTRLWLGADFDVEWRHTHHSPRPQQAMPDVTFYTNGKLDLGGETVEYGNFPQAHTDGDLYVHFPASNVLVAGGMLTNKIYPTPDIATGGWIGGLIKANEGMLAIANDQTLIIPDRGPAMRKTDLKAQFDMLSDLYERMKELEREGHNDQDMLKDKLTAKYDAVWGSPDEFVKETYRGMWAHTYDMGGFI